MQFSQILSEGLSFSLVIFGLDSVCLYDCLCLAVGSLAVGSLSLLEVTFDLLLLSTTKLECEIVNSVFKK